MEIIENGDGTYTLILECYDCGTTVSLHSEGGKTIQDIDFRHERRGKNSWKFRGYRGGRKQFDEIKPQFQHICGLCH